MSKNTDILFLMRNIFKGKGIWYTVEDNKKYLEELGISSALIAVDDPGLLDSIIKQHSPKLIFIEGSWLHPNKLKVISKNNPQINNFIIRYHSDISFFAVEIFGFEWMYQYTKLDKRVIISSNCENFSSISKDILYLPNLYNKSYSYQKKENTNEIIIYQAGAIRLMKNHLTQLFASMKFAEKYNKKLIYYINSITNNGGESVFRNMKAIKDNNNHNIELLPWLKGNEYIDYINKSDIGTQLSFSESFNNVAADFISNGRPILGGDTIEWLPEEYKVDTYTNIAKVSNKLEHLYNIRNDESMLLKAYKHLEQYNDNSKSIWKKFIEKYL